jgi:formate dehydrogenase subunit gamma
MPPSQAMSPADRADEIATAHLALEGPLLPILHAVQHEFGHIPDAAIPRIADRLNISKADVHGVVSFYHDFRTTPAGRHVVKLCRAEACQAMGADVLVAHAEDRLGIAMHETTRDGAVTLEPVFCLGLCACGPAAMIDGRIVGRLDAARLDALLDEVAR